MQVSKSTTIDRANNLDTFRSLDIFYYILNNEIKERVLSSV